MSSEPSERDLRLEQVIAEYVRLVEDGRSVSRQSMLEAHPDLADDLASFFRNRDAVDRMARPLQEALAAAEMPTLASGVFSAAGDFVPYFGDYELLEEVARGGMGVVFKARQVNLNRVVALKMILAGQLAGPEDVQRFRAEAEAAAQLDHPGIVPIFEVGKHEEQHYFSMGFVEGGSLAQVLREGPLPPREAAEVVRRVAEAVQYAHDRGVIHRDLKPANILLQRSAEIAAGPFRAADVVPKVTDFGLAKRVQGDSGLTQTGQILGTPSFMPPEQASGRDAVGRSADVYSLGAVLYCALTGRPPFQAASPVDTLLQVLDREPVPVRQLNPQVPVDLETIVQKCLEKDSRRRYDTARELADELARFVNGEPILARPVSRLERGWRWCRRKPALAALTGAVMALILVVTIGGPIAAWQQSLLREAAETQKKAAERASTAANTARTQAEASRNDAQRQTLTAYAGLAQAEQARSETLWSASVLGRQERALAALKSVQSLRERSESLAAQLARRDAAGREQTARFWADLTPRAKQQAVRWLSESSLQLAVQLPFNRLAGQVVSEHSGGVTIVENPGAATASVLAIHPDGRLLARYHPPDKPGDVEQVELFDVEKRIVRQTFVLRAAADPSKPQAPVRVDAVALRFTPTGERLRFAWRELDSSTGTLQERTRTEVREVPGGRGLGIVDLMIPKPQQPPGIPSFFGAGAPQRIVLSQDASLLAVCPKPPGPGFPMGAGTTSLFDGSGKLLSTVPDPAFEVSGFSAASDEIFGLKRSSPFDFSSTSVVHFDVKTGKVLREYALNSSGRRVGSEEIALSPDGQWLAFAFPHDNQSVQVALTNARTGKLLAQRAIRARAPSAFPGQPSASAILTAFGHNGRTLAVVGPDRLHVLSTPDLTVQAEQSFAPQQGDGDRNLNGPSATATWVATQLEFVGRSHVLLLDIRKTLGQQFGMSGAPVMGREETVQFWDYAAPRVQIQETVRHDAPIQGLALGPDRTTLFAGKDFGAIPRDAVQRPTMTHVAAIQGELDTGRVQLTRDVTRWMVAQNSGPVWPGDRSERSRLDGTDSGPLSGFDATGKLWLHHRIEGFGVGFGLQSLEVFDASTGHPRKPLPADGVLVLSASRRFLVLGNADPQALVSHLRLVDTQELVEPADKKPGIELTGLPANGVRFSPGERYLVGVHGWGPESQSWIVKTSDGSVTGRLPVSDLREIQFDSSGERMLVRRPMDPMGQKPRTSAVVELATGKALFEAEIEAAAFSPDGRSLAFTEPPLQTAGADRVTHVRVWREGTPEVRVLPGEWGHLPNTDSQVALQLSTDGSRLVVEGAVPRPQPEGLKRIFELWNVAEPKKLAGSLESEGSCTRARVSRKVGRFLVDYQPANNYGANLRCELRDLKTGELLTEFPGRRTVHVSGDEAWAVLDHYSPPGAPQGPAPEQKGQVLLDIASGKILAEVSGDGAFSEDSRRYFGRSGDVTAVWSLPEGRTVTVPARLLEAVSPDGTLGLSVDKELQVWDLTTGGSRGSIFLQRAPNVVTGTAPQLTSAVWSRDGQNRLAVNVSGQVRLLNPGFRSVVAGLPRSGHVGGVLCVAASSDGKWLATGGTDRTVGLWSTVDGQYAQLIEGFAGAVTAIAVHPSQPLIFVRDETGTLVGMKVISKPGRSEPDVETVWQTKANPGSTLALSADGSLLATVGPDQRVMIVLAKAGKPFGTPIDVPAEVTGLAFLMHGKTLVTTGGDGQVRLHEIESGRLVRAWDAGQGSLSAVATAPKDDLIVTAAVDLRLWSSFGTPLLTLEQHTRPVRALRFMPDGRELLSAGEDQLITRWNLHNLKTELTPLGLGW